MSKFEETISEAKKLTLTEQEKNSGRDFLIKYMDSHPIPPTAGGERPWWSALTSHFSPNFIRAATAVSLSSVVILATGGGLAYAAEGALPGDALYPVKVKFNEEVVLAVSSTPKDKADWQAQRVHRRLEEAEKLAAQGKLNNEQAKLIATHFTAHTASLDKIMEQLRNTRHIKTAVDISNDLESALGAHQVVLEKLAEEETQVRPAILMVADSLQQLVNQTVDSRLQNENRLADASDGIQKKASENRLATAESKIDEVRKLLGQWQDKLGAEATQSAETRIGLADQMIKEGKSEMQDQNYLEAFKTFQDAHRLAQEGKLLIEARKDVKIAVNLGSNVRDELQKRKDQEQFLVLDDEHNDQGLEEQDDDSTTGVQIDLETSKANPVQTENGPGSSIND